MVPPDARKIIVSSDFAQAISTEMFEEVVESVTVFLLASRGQSGLYCLPDVFDQRALRGFVLWNDEGRES
jgi:hypothetical protein